MFSGLYARLCLAFLVSFLTILWVVCCEATQLAAAATNHSALSSDEMSSADVKSDEAR